MPEPPPPDSTRASKRPLDLGQGSETAGSPGTASTELEKNLGVVTELTERLPVGAAPPAPPERTAVLRRSSTRALAGLVVLALLAVVEVARRATEAPATVSMSPAGSLETPAPPLGPTLSAAPTPTPGPEVSASLSPTAESSLPEGEASPPLQATARLEIDFEYGLKSGTLVVYVDNQKVLEEPLRAKVTGKFLAIERRHGSVHRIVAVPPGQRQVRVQLLWEGKQRSESTVRAFKEGATRRLVAELGPFKKLSLAWE